jgi:hypothetical protein
MLRLKHRAAAAETRLSTRPISPARKHPPAMGLPESLQQDRRLLVRVADRVDPARYAADTHREQRGNLILHLVLESLCRVVGALDRVLVVVPLDDHHYVVNAAEEVQHLRILGQDELDSRGEGSSVRELAPPLEDRDHDKVALAQNIDPQLLRPAKTLRRRRFRPRKAAPGARWKGRLSQVSSSEVWPAKEMLCRFWATICSLALRKAVMRSELATGLRR